MKLSIRWEDRIGPILYIGIKGNTFGFCLCHRRKDRSFHFSGLENFLCSRCFGALTGGIIAIILRFEGILFPVLWSFVFVFPLIIDGLHQAIFKRESNNILRFITGILCGFGLVFIGAFFGNFINQLSLF
jgi:uncharacterized membrane protein